MSFFCNTRVPSIPVIRTAFLGDTVRWNAEAMPDAVNATIQIVRDVYTQTRATFPGVPLMFVLGNHDTIPEWSTEVCAHRPPE